MSTRVKRQAAATFMSEDAFLALPEGMLKTELIDGEVVREPSPGFTHQDVLLALAEMLRAWARTRSPQPTVGVAPLDVRFAPARILQPDLLLFLEPLSRPVLTPIERIPDLCIEIVSARGTHDRVTKRMIYADAGVHELWTVLAASSLVERWTGPRLATREEFRGRLTTPLLPGFELDVVRLLSG